MNALSVIKRKMKNAVVPIISGGAIVFVTASNASAAMDLASVTAAITAAIADISAAGLILVGAYAAVWGVKQVKMLFVRG
jgi:hypothetical protein